MPSHEQRLQWKSATSAPGLDAVPPAAPDGAAEFKPVEADLDISVMHNMQNWMHSHKLKKKLYPYTQSCASCTDPAVASHPLARSVKQRRLGAP